MFKLLKFNTYSELGGYFYDLAHKASYAVAILYYKDVLALMKEMLEKNIEVNIIELDNPKYSDYKGEYYVSLTDENIFAVEKVYRDGSFITAEGVVTLVDGNIPYKLVEKLPIDSVIYEIDIDDITDDIATYHPSAEYYTVQM
jgi:hypothetical protein